MKWIRFKGHGADYQDHIVSHRYVIQLTGGSIIIMDRETKQILKRYTGHKYLYTGDISPDESECFALENGGKHFYVYSLDDDSLIIRVTLPRSYEAMDTYGHYSDDGKYIYIPASRWVTDLNHTDFGYYEFIVCRYETEQYRLVDKAVVDDWMKHRWELHKFWEATRGI